MDRTLTLLARLPVRPQVSIAAGALFIALVVAMALALKPHARATEPEQSVPTISQSSRDEAQRELAQAMSRFASLTTPAPSLPIVQTDQQLPTGSIPAPAGSIDRRLSDADMRRLAEKAASAIRDGDIAGARVILERDATAILALAQTHDPRMLERMGVRGLKGDLQKARALYQEALAKGIKEAGAALSSLTQN
jgi:hypothetical protein